MLFFFFFCCLLFCGQFGRKRKDRESFTKKEKKNLSNEMLGLRGANTFCPCCRLMHLWLSQSLEVFVLNIQIN